MGGPQALQLSLQRPSSFQHQPRASEAVLTLSAIKANSSQMSAFALAWLLLSILLEVFQPVLMRCRARRAPKLFVCHSSWSSTPQSTFLSKCSCSSLLPQLTECCAAKQSKAKQLQLQPALSPSCSALPGCPAQSFAQHQQRTMLPAANIHISPCYSVWAHYSYFPCSEPYILPPGVLSSLLSVGHSCPIHQGPRPQGVCPLPRAAAAPLSALGLKSTRSTPDQNKPALKQVGGRLS